MKPLDAAMLEAGRALPPPTISNEPARARLHVSGVPELRRGNTFASFRPTDGMRLAVQRCQEVAAGGAWCAFLYGPPGTGKTHLAIAALHERGAGLFWKAPDFLAFLRAHLAGERSGDPVSATTEQMIHDYGVASAPLVLDDLGTENQTDWANEQLYRILDGRYEQRAPTILTSNVPSERVDQRIWSRYREGLVICEGEDVRGR